ncbi:MAG TPA: hypothetical protein VF703_09935 [Pyrinomonadaceae bacterium]
MKFNCSEDQDYFRTLLCEDDEDFDRYESLFDVGREPKVKRDEFNRIRGRILNQLKEQYGLTCQLGYADICDINSGVEVDHIIPLSSNKLNKELRNLPPLEKGKKVPSQSLGSNHLNNLAIACKKCNAHKKHRLLSKSEIKRILATKGV